MSFKMEYNCGNPNVVYTCENCGYIDIGETYITDRTMTTGCGMVTNTIFTKDMKPKNNSVTFIIK